MRLLALNGSVRGDDGDGADVLTSALAFVPNVAAEIVTLATYAGTVEAMVARVKSADAFLVVTGTYWGSWGSPLQRFLEVMTPLEATAAFLGKPVACVVTMDSVGGSDVGARLLSAFGTMGAATAPFPLVVLSRTGLAVQGREGFEDVWQPKDLEVTMTNLVTCAAQRSAAAANGRAYASWTVERGTLPTGAGRPPSARALWQTRRRG